MHLKNNLLLGAILKEASPVYEDGTEENVSRRIHVIGQFKEFHYWNLDRETSEDDDVTKAMNWIDLAKVVCFKHVYTQNLKQMNPNNFMCDIADIYSNLQLNSSKI